MVANQFYERLVDLQALLNAVYDRAAYDITLNYTTELVPPLSATDAVWADALWRETSRRQSETSKYLYKKLHFC